MTWLNSAIGPVFASSGQRLYNFSCAERLSWLGLGLGLGSGLGSGLGLGLGLGLAYGIIGLGLAICANQDVTLRPVPRPEAVRVLVGHTAWPHVTVEHECD